jgi:hypothetical protein
MATRHVDEAGEGRGGEEENVVGREELRFVMRATLLA